MGGLESGISKKEFGILRSLIKEAGWSGEDFAKAVNSVGAEAGLALRYSRASVSQWTAGGRPRPPVPHVIAEALSRRLGRAVTAADIGWDDALGRWGDRSLPERLAELAAAAGSDRDAASRVAVYHLAALEDVGWRGARDRPLGAGGQAGPLGREELEVAAIMVRLLSEADRIYGAGPFKSAASGYLAQMVGLWLRAPVDEGLRTGFLAVASQLARLSGFMSFDDEAHGAAQRFYRVSLDLAVESNRPDEYAWTLRRMSGQAHSLGHFRSAMNLAKSASELRIPPAGRASVLSQVAIALAATGERAQALREIRRAENLVVQEEALPTSRETREIREYHYGVFVFDRAVLLSHLGDWEGAVENLRESLQYWSLTERRSRAIVLSRLAELQLRQGHLEQAVVTWHSFLDHYPSLNSRRLHRGMDNMRTHLAAFGRNPTAKELLRRAAHVTRTSSNSG
ncbi:hypothetical protein RND61_12150 [Streptomyces sp. TRM76323]|uniref:Regulatory protein n=1 Tax=Streptomyces tamarix TaxID=3078565 RepID=A0ABU3QJ99_9ACTN|nr:hypothetical protein [Streptomyces tamarix]MDT9682817.1 hypothetical protein [Streptomyces tamarix]